YLDRGRTTDGLRELDAARQLDSARADLAIFESLARGQLERNDAATVAALRRAATLSPDDSIAQYLLARELSRTGAIDDAIRAYERFAANEARRTAKSPEAL